MKRLMLLLLLLIVPLTPPAVAQPAPAPADFSLNSAADFAVPESSAFTVLGVTPQDVTRPGSPTALATAFLRAVGDNGKLQSGVAIDSAPYLALRGRSLTLGEYQKKNRYLLRFLARAKLSFGTTETGDTPKTQRMAAGLQLTLFDYGDPRRDEKLVACFNDAADPLLNVQAPLVIPETNSQDVDDDRNFVSCRKQSAKRNWNRSSWIVAGAPVWTNNPGDEGGFRSDGGGLWTSLAWGFEPFRESFLGKHAQVIAHWRMRRNEHVTKDNVTTDHDTALRGLRLRIGGPSFSGSIEVTRSRNTIDSGTVRVRRLLAGIEQTLTGNLSLQLSGGRETIGNSGASRTIVRSGFHWKFKMNE